MAEYMEVPEKVTLDMSRKGNIFFTILQNNTGASEKGEVFRKAISLLFYIVTKLKNDYYLLFINQDHETAELTFDYDGQSVSFVSQPSESNNQLPRGKPQRYTLVLAEENQRKIRVIAYWMKTESPIDVIKQALNVYDMIVNKIKQGHSIILRSPVGDEKLDYTYENSVVNIEIP